jgi:hypothetical protein
MPLPNDARTSAFQQPTPSAAAGPDDADADADTGGRARGAVPKAVAWTIEATRPNPTHGPQTPTRLLSMSQHAALRRIACVTLARFEQSATITIEAGVARGWADHIRKD